LGKLITLTGATLASANRAHREAHAGIRRGERPLGCARDDRDCHTEL